MANIGGAPSTRGAAANASGAGTPRRPRARGSNRAASPAAVDLAVPTLIPAANRAYGTEGLEDPSEQLVQQASNRAVASQLMGAVTDAQTGRQDRLPVVNEEVEGDQTITFQAPETPSRFSFTYWAPRGSQTTLAGYVVDGDGQRRALHLPYRPVLDARLLMLILLFVLGIVSLLVPGFLALLTRGSTRLGLHSHHNSSHDEASPISSYDYASLLHRMGVVEHNMKHLPPSSVPQPRQQINWFFPGYGAVIDPHLSSPTASTECDVTWSFWPLSFFRSCVEKPFSQAHLSALMTWDDPGEDRWCAPRSGGKLQLTVEIERSVAPTELVVEYAAKDASPIGAMGAAPRDIELWIYVEDDLKRATIGNAITRMYPDFLQDSSPQKRKLAAAQALSAEWVPVGRWTYNIYDQQNVQSLQIPIPLLEYGGHTDRVAVRVNSNWGDVDYTCINRLRLHGYDTSGLIEVLEKDPRGSKA